MWHALSFHSGYFRESKKKNEKKNNLLFEMNLIFWRKAPHFVYDDDDDAFGKIIPTRGIL